MKRAWMVLLLALALTGCDKKETASEAEPPAETTGAAVEEAEPTTEGEEKPAEDEGAAKDGAGEKVEVAAEGTKFDPAIKADQLPDGVWYCDMGTVHYARAEKGDGKCELCGMALKQKGAAAAEGDGHDHAHGDDDHDHGEHGHDH